MYYNTFGIMSLFVFAASIKIFPEDIMMNFFKSINPVTQKAVAGVLTAVLVFSVGFACGSFSKIMTMVDSGIAQLVGGGVQTAQPAQSQPAETQAPQTTAPQPSNDEPATDAPSADAPAGDNTDAPSADEPSADTPSGDSQQGASSGMPEGVDAIVEYYNTAANKVKTNASSVTLNYVDRMSNDEYLEVSGALKSVASFAMGTFLTKDENAVTYTGDDIKAKFPVKNEDYSSKLTAAQVKNATCTDNGTEYEIRIELNNDDTPNCTAGNGYGACMNYLGAEEITLDYPGLSISDVKLTYHDGVIVAKVDKATGNLVYGNYTLPVVLSLNAKLIGSAIPAQIGMTFVEDYTIAY